MEYVGINEEYDNYKDSWQDSKFIVELNQRQREKDFREGYRRGFEMAKNLL